MELYDWIARKFELPAVDLPDLDFREPRAAAVAVRSLWGLGDAPVPNLVQLAESKGIRVMGLPKIADDVDAFSLWQSGVPYIFLSMSKTPERTRFDLAHEIGHLLLHSRMTMASAGTGASANAAETEADAFASALLMPPAVIRESLPNDPGVNAIIETKTDFRVSAMALTRTLHEIGYLSDGNYQRVCMSLARQGFRGGEPGGLKNREASRVFRIVFDHLRSVEKCTAKDLTQWTGLGMSLIHDLSMGAAMHSVSGGGRNPGEAMGVNGRRQHYGPLRLVE